jgi:hypothetical protein
MLKFVPPKEDAKSFPRYASYGAGQLKTHGTLSGARNSLNNRTAPYGYKSEGKYKQGFILENVDGEWYVLYHVEEGSKYEDLPWVKKVWKHKQYGWKYDHDPSENSSWHKADDYKVEYVSTTMSKDEYADWRISVERERLGITQ